MKHLRWVAGLLLLVGVANLVRAGMAAYSAPVLAEWSLTWPWWLFGGLYLLWGVSLSGLAIALWRGQARRLGLPLAVAYQASLWLLHLLGDRSVYARSLWGRDLLLSALFLAVVAWGTGQPAKRLRTPDH